MPNFQEYGGWTRVTVTGTLSIGKAGGKIAIIGISAGVPANGTAPLCSIWQGQVTGSTTLIGLTTLSLSTFTRVPAICSGGATFNFANCDAPDITIYWNPIG